MVKKKRKPNKKRKPKKRPKTKIQNKKEHKQTKNKNVPKKFKQPWVIESAVNINLDGYNFVAEEFNNTNSLGHRSINKTKIFNGGEVSTFGEYVPVTCDFTTHIRVPENKPNYHDDLFKYLMSKSVKVISPLVGYSFNAYCSIERHLEKGTKNIIIVKFKLDEATDSRLTIDNELYTNKRLSIYDMR